MREILIGTGFYSTPETEREKFDFLRVWEWNTHRANPFRSIIVDNSKSAYGKNVLLPDDLTYSEIVQVSNNLGHTTDQTIHGNRLMGWSMSWIIPALIAYSENCDFVYKEQDCLAFGDWLSVIRQGHISYGTNSRMPCEQSLFYIERDTIPSFIANYMLIKDQDNFVVTEEKMIRAAELTRATDFCEVHKFDMPFGRERPLTIYKDRPWYAQKITPEELEQIKQAGLL